MIPYCHYCHKAIINFERITIENPSGLKRVFHSDCFFAAIGSDKFVNPIMVKKAIE